MSESTFSQSASPTTGLTNYSVEPRAKELYPAPTIKGRSRNRHAAWRKRFPSRGTMKKESTTMNANHTIEAMVDTLRKSVTSIAASNAANRDDLLAKSFDEFRAALGGEIEGQLAKAAPKAEEPLFKGLGGVGRVANLVGTLASQISTIQNGYESWQGRDGNPPSDADPASPELVEHLEDLLAHAEGILRVAVNEHCEPLDDGDNGDGYHVVMVPMSDGGGEVAVKTDLPTDLAKYATDPDGIDVFFADMAFSTLARAGVDTEALSKALAGGDLAKDASMMGAAQPTPADAGAAQPGDDGTGADGTDGGDPLDTLARLAALMMIQVDYLKQMVDGTNEPSDPTGENADPTDANAAAGADSSDATTGSGASASPSPDDVNKGAPGAQDLAKVGDLTNDEVLAKALAARGIDLDAMAKLADNNAEMKTRLDEFEALTAELLAKAAPAKAPLISSGVLKGAEDPLAQPGHSQQDLEKMSPTDRALAKMKEQQAAPRPFYG
jgi:hypothetical protein